MNANEVAEVAEPEKSADDALAAGSCAELFILGASDQSWGVWVLGVGDGGLGAVPPVGSRGWAPGQGAGGRTPHEAETLGF